MESNVDNLATVPLPETQNAGSPQISSKFFGCTKHFLELPAEPYSFAAHTYDETYKDLRAIGYQDTIHLTLGGKNQKSLQGHRGVVSYLKFTSNQKLISADYEGNICFWNLDFCISNGNSGKNKSELIEQVLTDPSKKSITDIAFNNLNTQFAAVRHDPKLTIWDFPIAKTMRTLDSGTENRLIHSAAFDQNDNISAGLSNGSIVFWDNKANLPEILKENHSAPVSSLAYHGDHLISAGSDSTIKIWELKKRKPLLEQKLDKTGEYIKNFKQLNFGLLGLTNKGNIYFLNAHAGTITPIMHRDLKNILYVDKSAKNELTFLSRNAIVTTDLKKFEKSLHHKKNIKEHAEEFSGLEVSAQLENKTDQQSFSYAQWGLKLLGYFGSLD
jgi:WD40 repeat protein